MKLQTLADLYIKDHGFVRALFNNNFHNIDNNFFRSAQPSTNVLRKYIKKYKFKTVVNLRNSDDSVTSFFLLEKKLLASNNVKMINVAISGSSLPDKYTLLSFIEIFKKNQRPLLVHCKSGADRTGFFSALYIFYLHNDLDLALKQFSLKYFHFKNSKTAILHYFFEVLRSEQISSKNLEEWISNEYNEKHITKKFKSSLN